MRTIFFARVLFATASCIGARLDCSNACSVMRIGFRSSIIDMIQEMGICGRGRTNDCDDPMDNFVIVINLNDYVYMNEKIYEVDSYGEK